VEVTTQESVPAKTGKIKKTKIPITTAENRKRTLTLEKPLMKLIIFFHYKRLK